MPRQARLDLPNSLQHITARGIEERQIFIDDQDHQNFLNRIGPLFLETRTICYAWALLPNHFHILVKTSRVPLSRIMRRLMTGYAVSFNKRHKRNGHLFQNRYKSIVCQEELYLRELIRYIHLNPLRVGLVQDLEELDDYRWCGHSALVDRHPSPFKTGGNGDDPVLRLFHPERRQARQAYRRYMAQGTDQGRRVEFQGGGATRSRLREKGKAAKESRADERILGQGDFVRGLLKNKARKQAEKKIQMSLEELIDLVAGWLKVEREELLSGRRRKGIGAGRALISHIGSQKLGYRFTELGQALNIHAVNAARNADRGRALFGKYQNQWQKAVTSSA
jgi:REP element-mobilizing transposase RayT